MNAEQLWDTTMNPEFRTLRKVVIDNATEADRVFSMLMGDEVPPRRDFIERNAKHLAKWYGMVETSIGPASETELVRDNQNNIASTLETYLFSYGMTDEIKIALDEFESWLRSSLVLTKNIIPHNVVLGYEGEKIILKIIDGLGSKSYLPLTQVSDVFAKRYVERRIELMRSRINWDLTGRQGDWK